MRRNHMKSAFECIGVEYHLSTNCMPSCCSLPRTARLGSSGNLTRSSSCFCLSSSPDALGDVSSIVSCRHQAALGALEWCRVAKSRLDQHQGARLKKPRNRERQPSLPHSSPDFFSGACTCFGDPALPAPGLRIPARRHSCDAPCTEAGNDRRVTVTTTQYCLAPHHLRLQNWKHQYPTQSTTPTPHITRQVNRNGWQSSQVGRWIRGRRCRLLL